MLDRVGFEVRPGEVFGLLGPNGAGKTTAFQVLTGLIRPDSGRIAMPGSNGQMADRLDRARTGVVFQEPALDIRLTARENLALAARLYRVGPATARDWIERLLDLADLGDRSREPVSQFSGGMRRRLEIARALIHEPGLLILDEPTTGLDEAAFRKTWSQLLELRKSRGLTLLLTSHRPEEAEQCDRIAILDGGKIVACDTPDRLRARVRGDLVILEAEDAPAIASIIADRFSLSTKVIDHRVVLEKEKAHELIPRLVEALPPGSLRSVSIRRAGLGEVFLELTGHDLEGVRDEDRGDRVGTKGRKR